MEPLKFEANITGNALQQLDDIQQKLESIKSVDIKLTIKEATGIENIVNLITEIKEAIKGGRFGAFAKKINLCAEAMSNLNEAFVKFNGTIGQDESLKNFMVGVGEVLKNVKFTMSQLEGTKLGLNTQDTTTFEKNAERLHDALFRIQGARAKVWGAIKEGESIGMSVGGMKYYLRILDAYEKKLQNIRSNPLMMQEANWQAHTLGTTFKYMIKNAGDFQKLVDEERKTFENNHRAIREEIDRTISKIKELDTAISRGTNAGRDMTALSDARSRLAGNLNILQHMTPADKKDTALVEKRVENIRALRDETEELRRSENKLTLERERANKAKEKADTKALNEEIKSVNDALVKYNELSVKIKEIEALRERGVKANIDVTQADTAIDKLKLIKEMLGEIAYNYGRTNASPSWGGNNVLTKDLLASEGAKKAGLESDTALKEYKASLADVERRMNAAAKTAENLGRHIDKMQAKKVDFNGLDTSKLDAAMLRIREIQNELIRFASTGQSAFGNTANEIVRAMGLASANKEAADATAQLNRQLKENGAAATGAATAQLTEQEKQLAQAIKKANDEGKSQSQLLNDLKSLATQYLSVWGTQQFLQNIIEIGGQLESQRLSLTAILGQRSYANDLFTKIQAMAVKSPFGVVQLDQYSKNLSAFGFQYNELFDMTKRLADIAAGTGTDFGRLALAIGHVRNEMALTGYTLRQFSMANVPMLKKLSENLGVTTEQIRKMVRAKEVSYQDVEKVLKDLTDEGGMFYNMQEVMSEAVSARFKNLKDSMDIMYGQMAESKLGGILKSTATGLMEVTKRWQAFGSAILVAAGGMGLYKLSQLAVNAAIKAMAADVTVSRVSLAAKNAEEIRAMALDAKWTASTLIRLVLTKQLTFEQAELAAAELGVDAAMLKNISTMGVWNATARSLGGAALGSLLASPWVLVTAAIAAAVGVLMEYKQWSDSIVSDVKTYIDTLRTAQERLGMYVEQAKKEQRPAVERDYRAEIEQMTTILKDSGLYSKELERQAGLTSSLSKEYDYLLTQMKEADKVMISISASAEKIAESVKASSTEGNGFDIGRAMLQMGTAGLAGIGVADFAFDFIKGGFDMKKTSIGKTWDFFFNDDINKNAQQLADAAGEYERRLNRLEAYKDRMKDAADMFGNQNKSLEDQIILLSRSDSAWEEFVNKAVAGSGALEADLRKDLSEVRNLAGNVSKHWEEVLTDDVPRMLEQMADKFHGNEEELKEDMRANKLYYQQYLDAMLEKVKSISPQMKAELQSMMWDWVNGPKKISEFFSPKAWLKGLMKGRREMTIEEQKREAEEQQKIEENVGRKAIGFIAAGDLPSLKKLNKTITAAWLSKYISDETSAKDIEDDVIKKWKEYTEKATSDKKMGRKSQAAQDEAEAKRLKALIDYYGFEDKKDKNKGGSSSSSYKDEYAKRWDERIRIMKEAYDWYDKWEKKVSEDSAFAKVEEKYGDIFKEWETDHLIPLKFNAKDIKDFEKYVTEYTQAAARQYNQQKNDKSKNYGEQALRVLRYGTGVLTDMNYDRFSKESEEFTSSMKRDIDELTRRWNIFMGVINSTGNASLAGRLSGLNPTRANFKTTAADIKAVGIQSAVSKAIDFTSVLSMSDKEIEQYAKTIGVAEDQIAGLIEGLKEWKKEQQDLNKSDLENYARFLGSLMDVESQLTRIRGEYNKEIEETNRLLESGQITADEASRREASAVARRASKEWGLTSAYSNLYSNSLGMAQGDFAEAYAKEMVNLDNLLKTGAISLDDYSQKVGNLNKIAREFSESGFLGIRGGVGSFLSGGVQGLVGYYDRRSAAARRDGNSEEADRYKKMADALSKQQKAAEQVTKALQDLANMSTMLGGMFDALGNEGAANAFNDTAGVLNGIASGANSLSSFGPWGMAAGAAIGGITSLAQMHDAKLQRQIEAIQREIDALEANTEAIKTARERTLGYDTGDYRRSIAALYQSQIEGGAYDKSISVMGRQYTYTRAAATAMLGYYGMNSAGTGYAQEYENLKKEREKYMDMYDAENDKKKTSQEALDQYKQKIAELDDQIINFSQDLAKSLWGIDIKGWADQISDALVSAFENGENMLKAFDDTVKSIMQNVVRETAKIGIIEPMMQSLKERLFGTLGDDGKYKGGAVSTEEMLNSPRAAAQKMIATIADYFKPGGEGSKMSMAMQEYLEGVNDLYTQLGYTNGIKSTDSANTLSASIQGIKEEQADILAGIVRSMWQDVASNRLMLTSYFEEEWPDYIETINNSVVPALSNIDSNVAAITALLSENGDLHRYIRNVSSHMDELVYGNERLQIQ